MDLIQLFSDLNLEKYNFIEIIQKPKIMIMNK